MGINYGRLRGTAERLIRENGKVVQLITPGAATGDPWNPQPGTPTERDAHFVETGYSMTMRNATLVLQGDKLGLLSTEGGAVPVMTDQIRIDGVIHQMIDIQPLNPGGVVMLFEVHARK